MSEYDVYLPPHTLLVFTSLLSGLVATVALVAFNCRTFRLNRGSIKRQISPFEQRTSIVHYLVLVPLLELFVIWGHRLGLGIGPSSAFAVLLWTAMLLGQLLALLTAICSAKNFRMMVHVTQILAVPCMLEFFIDRVTRQVIGVEIGVISALLVCGVIEVYTVPDFFRPDTLMHQDYEMKNAIYYTTSRSNNLGAGAAAHRNDKDEDDDGSGHSRTRGSGTQDVHARREKERNLGLVMNQIVDIEIDASADELRDAVKRWKRLLAVFAEGTEEDTTHGSSLSDSRDIMPWDRYASLGRPMPDIESEAEEF